MADPIVKTHIVGIFIVIETSVTQDTYRAAFREH